MKRYAVRIKGTNLYKGKSRERVADITKARLYTNVGAIKTSIGEDISYKAPDEMLERLEKAEKEYNDAKHAVYIYERAKKEIDKDKYEVVELEVNIK